jgi:type II secretory pathway component PulC
VAIAQASNWRDLIAAPQRLLPWGCALVLALLVGRELYSGVATALEAPAVGTASADAAAATGDEVERIVAANLFGVGPDAAQSPDQPLPETALALVLRGVFTASDPARASAIIESGDGQTQMVRVGSSVAPDTVLEQVFPNRVVLARNGLQESLYFPTPAAGESGELPSLPTATGGDQSELSSEELTTEQKRENILRRLEELRSRSL